jgi:hypothetical protein
MNATLLDKKLTHRVCRAMQEQSQVIIQDVSKLPEFVDNGKNLSATSAFR